MKSNNPNTVWQGRLHIGDEPGLFGDATYVGLSARMPLDLIPFDPAIRVGEVTILVECDGIAPDRGYPGHLVALQGILGVRGEALGDAQRITADNGGRVTFRLTDNVPRRVVLSIDVDGSVDPGLYQEIVLRRIQILSSTHYAYLGYRFEPGSPRN